MTTKRRDAGDGGILERPGRPPGSRFEGRVWVKRDGRPYRKSVYGPTRADVKAKVADEKLRAKTGLRPTDERLTVAVYIDRWLARDREVKERTIVRYRSLLMTHVVPTIGDRKLTDLQPDDVRLVLSKMKLRGLSPLTRSHVKAVLGLVLGDAEIDGHVIRNVARIVTFTKPSIPKPRALERDEIEAIVAAVEGDRLAPVYLFAIATGARLGEILGLRWTDVRKDKVYFAQTVGRLAGRDLWGEPKNASSTRWFPLTDGVASVLAAQKSAQDLGLTGAPPKLLNVDGIRRGPLVFTALDGGPLSPSYVTHNFQRLLAAAGIPRLRMHDMRHAFVSTLADGGVPIEVVSGLIGHSSSAVTRSTYLHLFDSAKMPAASVLDRFFAKTGS